MRVTTQLDLMRHHPLSYTEEAAAAAFEPSSGDDGQDSWATAFGVGKGKHAGKRRKKHSNKYARDSEQVTSAERLISTMTRCMPGLVAAVLLGCSGACP